MNATSNSTRLGDDIKGRDVPGELPVVSYILRELREYGARGCCCWLEPLSFVFRGRGEPLSSDVKPSSFPSPSYVAGSLAVLAGSIAVERGRVAL